MRLAFNSPAYEKAKTDGQKLLDKHGLHDWRISIENLRNAMFTSPEHPDGFWQYCDFDTKTIYIDYYVGRKFRQTMLHEIAHALVGKSGHGEEWWNKAAEIGCTFISLFPYLYVLRHQAITLEPQQEKEAAS
jgi:hypothetical protein